MKYDFTTAPDRRGKDSIAAEPNRFYQIDVPTKEGFSRIPMWVADMNFPTCPEITRRMIERIEHPCFGYFEPREELYEGIINWHKLRHGEEIKKEHIAYQNGVLGGVVSALNVLCSRGDNVLFHSPTYIGFTHVIDSYGYNMVLSDLKQDDHGVWRMDFADMERKIKEYHIHAAVFCNPHNPCGRVWTREEIREMMDLFAKYEVYVISDEIWSDLILEGYTHVPAYSVSDYAKMHTVTEYAPSKTFSLAGIVGSYHICFDGWLNERIQKESNLSHYNEMSVLWMYAMLGAYSKEGQEWTDELCQVLSENVNEAYETITTRFDGVSVAKPEGTYMLFLDCEKWCASHHTSMDDLLRKGVEYGVLWQDGRPFHRPYAIRMNVAVPNHQLKDALERLDRYVFNAEED
ncbi:MAG: aminotransferase class I/II-fold pyridoxal phosphate-dependent enzyme [Solobacterium sp.]|nr:aminotransferase class I/II-fold pyridoxal phosphate-dependent enzyme [Solobacterium sp.]